MTRRALVLGAGGHAAIAWEIGMIAGLADAGHDVRSAGLIVGTSAGSLVGVQIASGIPLDELFARQQKPIADKAPVSVDFNTWRASMFQAREGGGTAVEILKRVGTIAARIADTNAAERRRELESRLAAAQWPEQRLSIVAVDTGTGERRVFDRNAGVALADAVAASCAVPGIWPAVAIQGHRYMDGGMYSIDNADLAADCDEVLILTLRARVPALAVVPLESAVDRLRTAGTRVQVVLPDEASEKAFASVGGNVLDPAVREAAALAGRQQGRGSSVEL